MLPVLSIIFFSAKQSQYQPILFYKHCINNKSINSSQGKTILLRQHSGLIYMFTLLQSFIMFSMEIMGIKLLRTGFLKLMCSTYS